MMDDRFFREGDDLHGELAFAKRRDKFFLIDDHDHFAAHRGDDFFTDMGATATLDHSLLGIDLVSAIHSEIEHCELVYICKRDFAFFCLLQRAIRTGDNVDFETRLATLDEPLDEKKGSRSRTKTDGHSVFDKFCRLVPDRFFNRIRRHKKENQLYLSILNFEKTMITLQDLSQYLQQLLSPQDFADFGPNGIQVEGKSEIKRIAFAVSSSLATIQEAEKRGADALIVHHGIFWDKNPLVVTGRKKEKLYHLLRSGISLIAYHLPLDAHNQLGNNWKAAMDLGMTDLDPFYPIGKIPIGVKGKMAPISIAAFQKKLETYYGHTAHVALGGKSEVRSAAIISGGAHRQIEEAADEGVDCYITGSFDEPVWDIAHERKINFFALGHYATERVGIYALMADLHKQFQIPCEFIDLFNPF